MITSYYTKVKIKVCSTKDVNLKLYKQIFVNDEENINMFSYLNFIKKKIIMARYLELYFSANKIWYIRKEFEETKLIFFFFIKISLGRHTSKIFKFTIYSRQT